jgi:hypothetical protein
MEHSYTPQSPDISPLIMLQGISRSTTHQAEDSRVASDFFGEVEGEEDTLLLTTTTDPIEDVRRLGIASLRKCTMKYWLCLGSPR